MDREKLTQIGADVKLGEKVLIHDFVNLFGCTIGDETKIGAFVEIGRGVVVGKRCKISMHTSICEGITLEDEVFLGPNVTFINDRYPSATTASGEIKSRKDWNCETTLVKRRASIGASSTILCGITIGEGALIGAGSVVTRDVPDGVIVAGNPARVIRKN